MNRWILGYIDPGTGGLLLQFLLGGVAGLAAFVRYRWTSIRQRFGPTEEAAEEHPNQ
jgi:hypothetical protein